MDYAEMLRTLEAATSIVSDEQLRRVAFDRLLEHELAHLGLSATGKREGALSSVTKKKATRPKGGTRSAVVREQVKELRVSPDAAGLPSWDSLTVSDKYLWILKASKAAGVDGLTASEISHLAFQVFRENYRSNQISNLKDKIKSGFVELTNVGDGANKLVAWRILRKGMQHLEALASNQSASS